METLLLVAGVILLSGAVVLAFRSASSGVAMSYLGISAVRGSKYVVINDQLLLFWAMAAMIVLLAGFWQRRRLPLPNLCLNYIVGGTLVGMIVGAVLGYSAMVGGAMAGALLGGVAWKRTRSGEATQIKFWRILAEVGLPAVVTMSIVGIALNYLVRSAM